MNKIINKLIRQYGEHGNDYSVLEIGDTLNDVLDVLTEKGIIEAIEELANVDEVVGALKSAIHKNKAIIKKDEKGGYCARSPSSGDKVYYILNDVKRWVRNLETLTKMGFGLHNVKNITNEEMDKFKTEEGIDLREPKPLEVQKPKDGGFDKYNL